jgi:uncharacterized protein YjgD (DUF1641 family)
VAKPRDSVPESATNAARNAAGDGDGEAALREALAAHGDDLAAAVERTDELGDVLATAILVTASADESDLDRVTATTANLVGAVDGLATEEGAALAADVGGNADELSAALETVLDLQREGHLEDLATVAAALAESLSPDETEELATMLEENGTEFVEALDLVLDLQREGRLEDLVGLARTLSVLEVDEDAAAGLNSFLASVAEAERDSEPLGVFGALRQLRTRDARAGIGYLVAILKAQGRRLGGR